MRNQLIYDVECHKKEGLISAKQNKATEALYNGIEKCYDEKIAWLKSLRPQPKQEWNEEDELKRDNLIGLIEEIKRQPLKRLEDWDGYINWLKSLRPSWKPSEEQVIALRWVLNNIPYNMHKEHICHLYEQLKELM